MKDSLHLELTVNKSEAAHNGFMTHRSVTIKLEFHWLE